MLTSSLAMTITPLSNLHHFYTLKQEERNTLLRVRMEEGVRECSGVSQREKRSEVRVGEGVRVERAVREVL